MGLLDNRSSIGLTSISLKVALLDSAGKTVAEQLTPLALPHLAPDESGPFAAEFPPLPSAASAKASLAEYETGQFSRGHVSIDHLDAAPSADGGLTILGRVNNLGEQPVAVPAVAVVARDGRGQILGVAPRVAGLSFLRPGESATFLASMPVDPGTAEFTAYVDALATVAPAGFAAPALVGQPRLLWTSQGLPIVVGAVRNQSSQVRRASIVVSLTWKGDVIGLANVTPPLPLEPDETRPFAQGSFYGLTERLRQRGASARDLEVSAQVDPLLSSASSRAPIPLKVEVQGFEAIGGSVILKGSATNTTATSVTSASAFAALRSTKGVVITAGWAVVAETLPPGGHAAFTLDLPLPEGSDLAMAEADVQAAGIQP